jgi:hypothetical protein
MIRDAGEPPPSAAPAQCQSARSSVREALKFTDAHRVPTSLPQRAARLITRDYQGSAR